MFCAFPEFFERVAVGDHLLVDVIEVYRLVVPIPLAAVTSRLSLYLGVFVPAEDQKVAATWRRDAGGIAFEQFDRTPNNSMERTSHVRSEPACRNARCTT